MRSPLGTAAAVVATLAVAVVGRGAGAADWNPSAWTGESTVELRTDCPEEGEHRFPVWLAVVDGQLYVRLGRRASERVRCTRSTPYLGVRIAGHAFDRVRMTPVPELADRVAANLRERYWLDVVVRHVEHPLTLRLAPE